jgi:hypothetical protein
MNKPDCDVISLFNDSDEIAENLRVIVEDRNVSDTGRYWLQEAAMHIDGLYARACDLQRKNERLEKKLAEVTK